MLTDGARAPLGHRSQHQLEKERKPIMKTYESNLNRIPVVLAGGGSYARAQILPDLPELGDTFDGRTVLEVRPNPLTWTEQKDPEVWQYSIWYLHLSGDIWQYVAVHEPESEEI